MVEEGGPVTKESTVSLSRENINGWWEMEFSSSLGSICHLMPGSIGGNSPISGPVPQAVE